MFLTDSLTLDVKAIVLDLDGTLYDKSRLPLRMVLRQCLYLPLLSAEQQTRRAMKGQYLGSETAFYAAFFSRMAAGRLFSARFARWWYWHRYMPSMVSALRRHYRFRDWFSALWAECRKRKIHIAVYSDYGMVEQKLQAIGLHADMFDYVVSAPELGGLKPSTECAHEVCKHLNVRPEECLFIGDRDDTDGETARAIGAKYYILNQ